MIANLEKLKECGFVLSDTPTDNYYSLKGVVIHVFKDTKQLFYNEVEILFASVL